MQLWTWVVLYLLVGALFATKGPAARKISWEVQRTPPTSKTKLRVFKFILVLAIVFFWPVLVISIIRTEKGQSATISALARTSQALEAGAVLAAMNPNPVGADSLPNASGEFGYTPDNPVPTTNILATEKFLNRLRHSDGQPLEFRRIGSFASETTEFPVDGYRVNPAQDDGQPVVLYFSPYQLRCSQLAPRGFKFAKTEQIALVPGEVPAVAVTTAPPKPAYKSSFTAGTEIVEHVDMLTTVSKRADEGDVDAQVEMALHFLTQQAPSTQNDRRAVRWLRKASAEGHARAQYELGNILVQGRLLPKNLEQARRLMRAAAEQNYPNASERLAAMLIYTDSQPGQTKSMFSKGPKDNIHAPSPHRNEHLKRSKKQDLGTAKPPLSMALFHWNEADSENQRFYAKGQKAALKCFATARERVETATSEYSIWTDFDVIRDEARAIAEKRGILRIGEDHGMTEIDGSDLFFDERRAAFINGVEDALEDATFLQDEELRWCRFLRQGHKVDRPMERTIQHEDTQTVYCRVQGQGRA